MRTRASRAARALLLALAHAALFAVLLVAVLDVPPRQLEATSADVLLAFVLGGALAVDFALRGASLLRGPAPAGRILGRSALGGAALGALVLAAWVLPGEPQMLLWSWVAAIIGALVGLAFAALDLAAAALVRRILR